MNLDTLKSTLFYNPGTGEFLWKSARRGVVRKVAGYKMKSGYVTIMVDQKRYYAHRLAWFYMTRGWPAEQIDHINRVRFDNRWCNLRLAIQTEQNFNSKLRLNNTSGHRGVYYAKDIKRWRAQRTVNGVWHHLGSFKTKEEAIAAAA